MSIKTRRTRKPEKLPEIHDKQSTVTFDKNVESADPHEKVRQFWYHFDQAWNDNKIGPECFGGSDFDLDPASIDTPHFTHEGFAEAEGLIKELHDKKLFPESTPPDNSWIQTYTGKKFFPLSPKIEDICIEDIAHSLSMLCRFTGHSNQFYSVAEHSILVSYLCDTKDALYGLLHDASEYALQDLPSPLKRSGKFEEYKKYESILQNMIFKKFNLLEEEPESVKRADQLLLATEGRDLMSPQHPEWKTKYEPLPFSIMCLSPAKAEQIFLRRFFELTTIG
jgi:uncharacterized protein